jgi:hypothetical protein
MFHWEGSKQNPASNQASPYVRWQACTFRKVYVKARQNGKQIVTLALAICWPLLNPRLCATQSSCRLTIGFY